MEFYIIYALTIGMGIGVERKSPAVHGAIVRRSLGSARVNCPGLRPVHPEKHPPTTLPPSDGFCGLSIFPGGRNNWGVLCTSLNMSTFGEVTMIIYIFKTVEWLADCNSQSVRCLRNELEKELEGGLTTGGQSMIYPKPSVLAKAAACDYFGKHLHKDRLRKDSWMYFHVLSEPLVHLSSWYEDYWQLSICITLLCSMLF